MITWFTNLFRRPSAHLLALRELEEAKRQSLAYRSAAEYNQRLSEYSDGQVIRLTDYLRQST